MSPLGAVIIVITLQAGTITLYKLYKEYKQIKINKNLNLNLNQNLYHSF
jgi:hypothetical protein